VLLKSASEVVLLNALLKLLNTASEDDYGFASEVVLLKCASEVKLLK